MSAEEFSMLLSGVAAQLEGMPLDDAMALAGEIAARSPGAVRGAKSLFNRLDHDGAAEAFAEERRVIGEQIGSKNQVEAVMSGFENRPPVFVD